MGDEPVLKYLVCLWSPEMNSHTYMYDTLCSKLTQSFFCWFKYSLHSAWAVVCEEGTEGYEKRSEEAKAEKYLTSV